MLRYKPTVEPRLRRSATAEIDTSIPLEEVVSRVVEIAKEGPMPEDREELLRHYRESREKLLAAIDGLSDDEMSQPSIDGWSVKDHLAHLALWDDIRAEEVERISAGYDSAWKMTDDQDEALNASGYEWRRSMPASQARWELDRSRRKLLDAIASCTPRALDTSLYGAAGLRSGHEDEHAEWLKRWRDGRRG